MKNKKLIIFLVVLILALVSFFALKKYRKKNGREPLKIVTVEKGSIRITVLATGITQPQNRLELKPPITGRIESIDVNEGEKVKKGQILAWLSSTERAALMDAARAQSEKELAYWENSYKPTPLVSPMDGVIIARNMEPGQTVTTQDAPLVMSDRLIVKAQVDETDIGQIRLKQRAEIVLDAYPDQKIMAEVNHVAYEAKTVNNVTIYEIDVLPKRVPPFMRAGMTANVTFIIQTKENILILPQEALHETNGEQKVAVPSAEKNKNGRPSAKSIRTGISDGKRVEVIEGLSEGDQVLVTDIKFDSGEKKQESNPFMPSFRRGQGGRSGSGSRNSK